MKDLGLRLRVFLLFSLITFGSVIAVIAGLFLGYRQLDDPSAASAFATSGIIAGFGITGLVALVWLLFDENLSKPIEKLAASLRVGTHHGGSLEASKISAQYLGDLGPAIVVTQRKLDKVSLNVSEEVARQTAYLENQKQQLLRILSDIPVAVIVVSPDHQIVLYDGQAAALMEVEAPARLNGSVFDYLDRVGLVDALTALSASKSRRRMEVTLKGHSGTLYTGQLRLFGPQSGYTLMLEPLSTEAERPLVYDFDLMARTKASGLDDTDLRDLSYVVFDSETTGLDPSRDRVVQLGAVRIVKGRRVEGEVFDTLIDPGMPIPPQSTRIHGIADDMVKGAPRFSDMCRAFHSFCSGAVIVAHNAPFDMAFLERAAEEIGVRFDQPILDTVHLSAVVFGGSADHTLDAICKRLNIEISMDSRHTAVGDATATADAFAAMLPILEARGIKTFADLKSTIRQHGRILTILE